MNGILANKVALITGAAGDVGRTIVRRFIEEGASVLATDFNQAALDEACRSASADGAAIEAHQHDVTSESDWQRVVQAAVDAFGHLDVLVNCAGMTPVTLLEDTQLEDWNQVIAVNTTGPLLGMKVAIPELKKSAAAGRGAAIVNIASAQGLVAGQTGLSAYTASKGALRLLTKTAAVEFGRLGYNVRANCVVPSALGGSAMVNRQISLQVERGVFADMEQGMKTINAAFPLGRTASPLDVAEAVVFLSSDRAGAITGIDLPVDAGRTA